MIAPEYGRVIHVGQDYFEVINEDGINNHALINERNELIIDYKYADYIVLSPDWCLAVVLEETQEEEWDYSDEFTLMRAMQGDLRKYNIVRFDVYNLSTATFLGSLTKQEYKDAKVAGPYLKVIDRAGDAHVYDASLRKIAKLESIYGSDYQVVKKGEQYYVISTLNGEEIAGGYIRASSDADTGLIIVRAEGGWFGGNYGAIDRSGNIIIPLDYYDVILL